LRGAISADRNKDDEYDLPERKHAAMIAQMKHARSIRIGAYFFRDRGRKAAETQSLLEQLSHPRGRRWFLPGGEISWFGSKSEFIAGRKKTGRKGAAYNHEALAFSLSIKRISRAKIDS